ncbi:MAG TPA: hypothetical protein VNN19_03170 [bacterium]|nr:hypothetical protein [bacterium]
MSVETLPMPAAAPRAAPGSARGGAWGRRHRRSLRSAAARFADDRQLVQVKLIVLGLLLLAAMALEVPL